MEYNVVLSCTVLWCLRWLCTQSTHWTKVGVVESMRSTKQYWSPCTLYYSMVQRGTIWYYSRYIVVQYGTGSTVQCDTVGYSVQEGSSNIMPLPVLSTGSRKPRDTTRGSDAAARMLSFAAEKKGKRRGNKKTRRGEGHG